LLPRHVSPWFGLECQVLVNITVYNC